MSLVSGKCVFNDLIETNRTESANVLPSITYWPRFLESGTAREQASLIPGTDFGRFYRYELGRE